MVELRINVNGIIVEKRDPFYETWFDEPDKTVFASDDFVEDTSHLKSGDILNVDVNTDGGSCDAGIRMYNACKDLQKKGVIVNTFNRGKQHSIGNIVMLGGSNRSAYNSSIGLIHLPYVPSEAFWSESGLNANDLQYLANDLRREEDRILNIYAKETGKDLESLRALMSEERILTATELKDWGFLTSISDETPTAIANKKAIAFAYVNLNKHKNMNEKELEELKKEQKQTNSLLQEIKNLFKPKAKNMDITGSDGKVLHLTKEEGDPAAGDEATVDGNPDGEVTLEDGKVVKVVGGAIESITEPEDETEQLKNQLEEANAKINELTEQLGAANQSNETIANKMATLEASLNKMNSIVTKWSPEGRTNNGSKSANKVDKTRVDFSVVESRLNKKAKKE